MIVGIGSDLCNIERIQNSLDRWGDKFLNRVFTETERSKATSRSSGQGEPTDSSLRTASLNVAMDGSAKRARQFQRAVPRPEKVTGTSKVVAPWGGT